MKKAALIMGLSMLATGCASMTPAERTALEQQAAQPVTCTAGNDCEVKWSRAMAWVQTHSAYRLENATDTLITTKGPLPSDPRPAYQITRFAQGHGVYLIDFKAGCDNMFGCVPSLLSLKADFAQTMNRQ